MSDDRLPVLSPPAERTDETTVRGVVLAAGLSSRFGEQNKLLESVDGRPVVWQATEPLLAVGLATTVILGHEADRVREALANLDVAFRTNEAYEDGQSTSVREGVRAAAEADAVLVALGDMPGVSPVTVRALVATYEQTGRSALAAAHEGTRGNPVLFDRRHFEALTDRTGDVGGRAVLLGAGDGALVETGDPGVLRDVDKPGDLANERREER
ncbi:nucleotidyltransferase family protein [Halorientalis sp.]|uniref:nucleotidyltransferase family protein n=1 Tax=Halorientalis sp. TaxID=1931229 RepID=UPI002602959F|nr:nucleotidyltransferase family protein [Halorientalis sp.]